MSSLPVRTYNPAFLSDDDLVSSYCVRTAEFESVVDVLREDGATASPHQIVIGPRGSGKTMLLLRVAAELRRDPLLSGRYLPVVFAEESYGVATTGEFWLECVSRLARGVSRGQDSPDMAATCDELRSITDEATLADRCLVALLDFADRIDRRLVIVVENLNTILGEMRDPDAGWRLRKTLQTEPRIVLLASASRRFAEIDAADQPLYDLFRVLTLRPLDAAGCARLWESLSGREARPGAVRALQILTGGNPRLFVIVARIGRARSFRRLLDDLLGLIDEHTEYFRGHLEALPAQERRVYLALADLWKPATASEIAERARLSPSQSSAQLARLMTRGGVEVAGGTGRRRQYYVTERLYNIYHLLRRAGGPEPLVEALVRFMESFYSTGELKTIGLRILTDASVLDPQQRALHDAIFNRLLALPALEPHRRELVEAAHSSGLEASDPADRIGTSGALTAAQPLFEKTDRLLDAGRVDEVLPILDEAQLRHDPDGAEPNAGVGTLVRLMRCGVLSELDRPSETLDACEDLLAFIDAGGVDPEVAASAEAHRAEILQTLGRSEDAVAANERIVARYGESVGPRVSVAVARAMANRALILGGSDAGNGVAASDEVLDRFGSDEQPAVQVFVAHALGNKGELLRELGRLDDSVRAYEEILRRYRDSEDADVRKVVALADVNLGVLAGQRGDAENALARFDDVERRYATADVSDFVGSAAMAAANRGFVLAAMDRLEDALAAFDEVESRYGRAPGESCVEALAKAQVKKGDVLRRLGRIDDAIDAFAEAERLADTSSRPDLAVVGAQSVCRRADALASVGRTAGALAAYGEAVDRCSGESAPELVRIGAMSLLHTGVALDGLYRVPEALDAYDQAIERCQRAATMETREVNAIALLNKGSTLWELDRSSEALRAWEEVVRRFGASSEGRLPVVVGEAWHAKGTLLREEGHPDAALDAFAEALGHVAGREDSEACGLLTEVHLDRLTLLGALDRHDELLASAEELKQMAGAGEPWHDALVGRSMIPVAQARLLAGNHASALQAVVQAEQMLSSVSLEDSFRICWVRALALLGLGDRPRCEESTETLLAILARQRLLPIECIARLIDLAVALGVQEMRDLVIASPARDLLRPFTVALEYELGTNPRVAVEIAEVAADILPRLQARLQRGPLNNFGTRQGRDSSTSRGSPTASRRKEM